MPCGHLRARRTRLCHLGSLLVVLTAVYSQPVQAETGSSTRVFSAVRLGKASRASEPVKPAPTIADVLKGATHIDGFVSLYRKDSQVYALLKPADLNRDLIVVISVARGIAQRPLFAGAAWGFGDDWVCQFRRVADKVHLVRRNTRYRAKPGTPEAIAVDRAFSDSILAALPIVAQRSDGTVLIDLSSAFLSDLPNICQALSGFEFSAEKSSWAQVEGFANNAELEVAATYTSDGSHQLSSVPDSRAVTIHLHYSICPLPNNNFHPRVADDRIGYFLSVAKDYSRETDEDRFVRFINRWYLEKQDPLAELSPPKQPIVFWIENTVPHKYRAAIRAGMLEWNKAFAKIGFQEAIVVRQQPEDAPWQPGDVRYNTFRWITSGISVAMGPSRVNPLTGQILDADIVFDADYLQMWKRKYEFFSPEGVSLLTGGSLDLASYRRQSARMMGERSYAHGGLCSCQEGMSHQLAMSSSILAGTTRSKPEVQRLTLQGVKKVAMHEMGHVLGLRHNFKGSSLYSLDEAYERSLSDKQLSLSGSVMDYLPAQLAPADSPQGNYYTPTIGPYDYWAIEYGYRTFDSSDTESEKPYLQAIASRSAEPGHAYATDEETRGIDADPHSGVFDFGNNLIEHANKQADLVAESWPGLIDRVTQEGNGYQHVRQAFGVLMATHCRAMFAASRYVGGVYSSRSHRGDPGARRSYEVVDPETQRQTLQLLSQRMFSDAPFEAPLQLCDQMAVTYWDHWESEMRERTDFPVHESILTWQDRILEKLLSPLTLSRLHDAELMIPADQDAFTVAELMERLTLIIFSEVQTAGPGEYTNRNPAISSLRRSLQSALLTRMTELLEDEQDVPSDCQAVVSWQLRRLSADIEQLQGKQLNLDTYTIAHLDELSRRIDRAITK